MQWRKEEGMLTLATGSVAVSSEEHGQMAFVGSVEMILKRWEYNPKHSSSHFATYLLLSGLSVSCPGAVFFLTSAD